jgi:hypothetical protein
MSDIKDQYVNLATALINKSRETEEKLVSLNKGIIFSFEYDNFLEFRFKYLNNASVLSEYEHLFHEPIIKDFPLVTAEERAEIWDKEEYERKMIINDLKFATHINMSKFNEPISSRRFVASNDSCLSFVQASVNDKCYRMLFVSRSTEVNRMLPADLYSIGTIVDDWICWFKKYAKLENDERRVKITFIMNNPHYYRL